MTSGDHIEDLTLIGGLTHLKVGSNYLTVTKEKENKLREDEIGLSGPQAIFTKFVHKKLC